MNTVACFLWGDWGPGRGLAYLYALQDSVFQHSTADIRFVCFTDRPARTIRDTIEVVPLNADDLEGNLKKMTIFRPCSKLEGKVLALDLDTVIVDRLDVLFEMKLETNSFVTCEDAYATGRIGGGVHLFMAGFGLSEFWAPLNRSPAIYGNTMGSERHYLRRRAIELKSDLDLRFWQSQKPSPVVSYKKECQGGAPTGSRIIWFHGQPRPHQVTDVAWIDEAWGVHYREYTHGNA